MDARGKVMWRLETLFPSRMKVNRPLRYYLGGSAAVGTASASSSPRLWATRKSIWTPEARGVGIEGAIVRKALGNFARSKRQRAASKFFYDAAWTSSPAAMGALIKVVPLSQTILHFRFRLPGTRYRRPCERPEGVWHLHRPSVGAN